MQQEQPPKHEGTNKNYLIGNNQERVVLADELNNRTDAVISKLGIGVRAEPTIMERKTSNRRRKKNKNRKHCGDCPNTKLIETTILIMSWHCFCNNKCNAFHLCVCHLFVLFARTFCTTPAVTAKCSVSSVKTVRNKVLERLNELDVIHTETEQLTYICMQAK